MKLISATSKMNRIYFMDTNDRYLVSSPGLQDESYSTLELAQREINSREKF